MHFLKSFVLITLMALSASSTAQGTLVDSTHIFSQLISRFYNAREAKDLVKYRKLIHHFYTDKPMTYSPDDSLIAQWGFTISTFPKVKVYDTVTVNGNQYCKVDYTLNCTKKLAKDQLDLVPHLDRLFGARVKKGVDGYFDNASSMYKHYPNRTALMVLKKGDATWRILEYDPAEVSSWYGIEPREVFYAVEGIADGTCKTGNYSQTDLGKLVYEAMVNRQWASLYCRAGIHRKELMWLSDKEGRAIPENKLYKNLRHKKETIEVCARRLSQQYSWKDTQFSQVVAVVETVKGISYSAILVEFIHDGKYTYFEIESVYTPAGWRIIDDINADSFREKNREFIAKRGK